MNQTWKFIGVGLVGVALGMGGTFLFNHYNLIAKKEKEIVKEGSLPFTSSSNRDNFNSFFDKNFDQDFFGDNFSPFKQMEKMRENMHRLFEDSLNDSFSSKYFDNWFEERFGGSVSDIGVSEDGNYIYYRIELEGVNKDNLNINVRDGQLSISGEIDKLNEDRSDESFLKSRIRKSFKRSFPVPTGVDTDNIDFETKENQLIVKFLKFKN